MGEIGDGVTGIIKGGVGLAGKGGGKGVEPGASSGGSITIPGNKMSALTGQLLIVPLLFYA